MELQVYCVVRKRQFTLTYLSNIKHLFAIYYYVDEFNHLFK